MIGTVACSSTRPTGPSLAQLSPLRPTSLSRRLVPAIKTRQQARACTVARRSQQLTSEDDAFATLKAPTPTCLASLTTSPSGLRGLKASRSLPQGEVVLFVPHTYSVSVPTGGAKSVAQWELEFLQPWQTKHGPLPPPLVDFLADTRADATTRISAWLLYLQKYRTHSSSSTASSNSNDFWRAWLALLPQPEEATNANGFWTPAELQQLQLEPYKGVMTAVNDLSARMCDQAYLQLQSGDLGQLQLAKTVDDVKWGVFATRTQASSNGDRVTLRPLHDLINHAEAPNATCSLTEEGYSIEALTYIPAGTEITISYTGDGPAGSDLGLLSTPSLELLMTWGFTLAPKPQDLIFPMQYHALPGLDWDAVLSAAAAVVTQKAAQHKLFATLQPKQQAAGPASWTQPWMMTGIKSQQEVMTLLQAAVANLPLTPPASSSSSTAVPTRLYRSAAEAISTYGLAGCCCADAAAAAGMSSTGSSSSSSTTTARLVSTAAGTAGPQQGMVTSPPIDLEAAVAQTPAWSVYERPYLTRLQLQELQAEFVSDLQASLSTLDKLRLVGAAAAGPIAAIAAALPLAFLQRLSGSSSSSSRHTAAAASGSNGGCSTGSSHGMKSGRQRVVTQLLVVTALLCEAQFALLQSGTTIQQDEALLAFLQGKSAAWTAVIAAGAAATTADVIAGAVDGKQLQQQQRVLPGAEDFKQRQQAVLRQLLLLQAEEVLSADGPAAAVAAMAGALCAAAPASKHQFGPAWQQASGKLTWGAGPAAAAAAAPMLLSTGSLTAALQGPVGVGLPMNVSAAIKVIKALLDQPTAAAAADRGLQPVGLTAFTAAVDINPELSTCQSIATVLAMQEQTIKAWQTQQQQQQQLLLSSRSAHAATCQAAVSEAAVLLSTGRVSRARFMVAVSARLQQKRLLQAYVTLLQELQQQLKSNG